ncbi:MAG: NAD(P)H-dependent oxidoreductase subunit E [Clostridiales bacterium]|nr:NAD(P)H-dependent oxidoreductase subunit E [Clostridiales bacterium]
MNEVLKSSNDVLSEDKFLKLKDFISSLGNADGIAMPVLQEAQNIFGYLPLEVHKYISENINVSVAELYGITTFYSQFTLVPRGKHIVSVCLGTACYVKGARGLLDKCAELLGVEVGETTLDRQFSLQATRCLGCCGLAPVMTVDSDVYAQMDDLRKVKGILDKYREKEEEAS